MARREDPKRREAPERRPPAALENAARLSGGAPAPDDAATPLAPARAEARSATTLERAGAAEAAAAYYADPVATFGDRVAAARQSAHLTQAELAERIGVGVRTVSGWEHDRAEPRANQLATLSGLLGVSVTWLLTGGGQGVPPPGGPPERLADRPAETLRVTVSTPQPDAARRYWVETLGCRALAEGEVAFFGHRLAFVQGKTTTPARLGVRIGRATWSALVERLRAERAAFATEPRLERVGAPDEEGVFALAGPCGLVVEFLGVGEARA